MTRIIPYFVEGHTGKGYINLIENNITSLEKVVFLQNKNPFVLAYIFQMLRDEILFNINSPVEIIQSIERSDYIDGIIVRNLGVAILNEKLNHSLNTMKEKVQLLEVPISLSNRLVTLDHKRQIQRAYEHFQKGLTIHEELERVYINEMDFTKADKVIDKLLHSLFNEVEKMEGPFSKVERLFGTNTPDGIVNKIPQLIEGFTKKIFITGRAGTGKSYLMNQVVKRCQELSLNVEIYRCSLDPDSIDMLLIRDLNVCIHDNTSPHIVSLDEDVEIIDMFKETVNEKVETIERAKINQLQRAYKKEMKLGIQSLAKLKQTNSVIVTKREQEQLDRFAKELKNKFLSP